MVLRYREVSEKTTVFKPVTGLDRRFSLTLYRRVDGSFHFTPSLVHRKRDDTVQILWHSSDRMDLWLPLIPNLTPTLYTTPLSHPSVTILCVLASMVPVILIFLTHLSSRTHGTILIVRSSYPQISTLHSFLSLSTSHLLGSRV